MSTISVFKFSPHGPLDPWFGMTQCASARFVPSTRSAQNWAAAAAPKLAPASTVADSRTSRLKGSIVTFVISWEGERRFPTPDWRLLFLRLSHVLHGQLLGSKCSAAVFTMTADTLEWWTIGSICQRCHKIRPHLSVLEIRVSRWARIMGRSKRDITLQVRLSKPL